MLVKDKKKGDRHRLGKLQTRSRFGVCEKRGREGGLGRKSFRPYGSPKKVLARPQGRLRAKRHPAFGRNGLSLVVLLCLV